MDYATGAYKVFGNLCSTYFEVRVRESDPDPASATSNITLTSTTKSGGCNHQGPIRHQSTLWLGLATIAWSTGKSSSSFVMSELWRFQAWVIMNAYWRLDDLS